MLFRSPELHGLTPALGVLMDRGHQVALLTDGRMSGASGKIPAAIQVTPEAAVGGPIGRIADGDVIRLDARSGTLDVLVGAEELARRDLVDAPPSEASWTGTGRELFGALRRAVGPADQGASVFGALTPELDLFRGVQGPPPRGRGPGFGPGEFDLPALETAFETQEVGQ